MSELEYRERSNKGLVLYRFNVYDSVMGRCHHSQIMRPEYEDAG